MAPKPLLLILLATVSAGLLGVATHLFQNSEAAATALAVLSKKRVLLAERLAKSRTRSEYNRRAQARLETRLASLQAFGHQLRLADGVNNPRPVAPSLAAQLVADPKLFDLYREAIRSGLCVRFGAQYRALGLSPAQIEKFEDLYTAHDAEIQELRATAEAQGVRMSDPDIASVRRQENSDYESAVAAATGLPGSAIEQIEQGDFPGPVQPLQSTLHEVERYAIMSGAAPLTREQQQQLTQIAAKANPASLNGGKIDPRTVDWNTVIAESKGMLSEAQIHAIQTEAQMDTLFGMVHEFNSRQSLPSMR